MKQNFRMHFESLMHLNIQVRMGKEVEGRMINDLPTQVDIP